MTNVISGIDAVVSAVSASKNPSVIVLAIGGGPSSTLDNAVVAVSENRTAPLSFAYDEASGHQRGHSRRCPCRGEQR